ncbi:MAG: FeS-binding protein [Deltaproteobacteria bacterium]|nr:FeS-binding protein [Deltaproteobacteria bacterium]
MKNKTRTAVSGNRRLVKWLYLLTFIVMAFTGFGQMPIFKRFYVSDVPGMGWSADFYLTHYIHYLGAIFLLALLAYVIVDYFLSTRHQLTLTATAYVRILLLAGIVVTGIIRVFKNLPDVVFSPGFTMFVDISHLGFMMFYLLFAAVCLVIKSGWVQTRSA